MWIFRIDRLFQIKIFKHKNAWVGFECMWSICCALHWPNHRHRTITPTAKTERVKYCERRSFVQPTDPWRRFVRGFRLLDSSSNPYSRYAPIERFVFTRCFALSRFMCNSMYINVHKCNAVPCAECRGNMYIYRYYKTFARRCNYHRS